LHDGCPIYLRDLTASFVYDCIMPVKPAQWKRKIFIFRVIVLMPLWLTSGLFVCLLVSVNYMKELWVLVELILIYKAKPRTKSLTFHCGMSLYVVFHYHSGSNVMMSFPFIISILLCHSSQHFQCAWSCLHFVTCCNLVVSLKLELEINFFLQEPTAN